MAACGRARGDVIAGAEPRSHGGAGRDGRAPLSEARKRRGGPSGGGCFLSPARARKRMPAAAVAYNISVPTPLAGLCGGALAIPGCFVPCHGWLNDWNAILGASSRGGLHVVGNFGMNMTRSHDQALVFSFDIYQELQDLLYGIESFSKLGDSIYFEEKGDAPALNIIQYIPSTCNWKAAGLIVTQKIKPLSYSDLYLQISLHFYKVSLPN